MGKPIGLLWERMDSWTELQKLLREHHVSVDALADESGVSRSQVNRILQRDYCPRSNYGDVVRVHKACWRLLPDMSVEEQNTLVNEYQQEVL